MNEYDKVLINELYRTLLKEGNKKGFWTWLKAKKLYRTYIKFLQNGVI